MASLFSAENRRQHRDEARGITLFVGAICLVFCVGLLLPLEQLGLVPRSWRGLFGVLSMPFLHANFAHLISNVVPLTVLLVLLAGSQAHSARVVSLLLVTSGVLLWLFGRTALHIGASGLVFALCSFLITAGILERRAASIAVATLVVVFYGSPLLSGLLPNRQEISWDGHLLGAIAGLGIAALMSIGNRKKSRR